MIHPIHWGALFVLFGIAVWLNVAPLEGQAVAHLQATDSLQSAAPTIRQQVIALALAEVGKPYSYGTEGPDAFDCSGLVQYVYGRLGIETTRTTFTQLEALRPVDVLQEGDMVYFDTVTDQHVGIVADLDQDGRWDMIHAAAPGVGVIVDYDVFSIPFFRDAIIGYRSAL